MDETIGQPHEEPEQELTLDDILPGLRPQPELQVFREAAGDLVVLEFFPPRRDGSMPPAPHVRARFPGSSEQSENDARRFVKAEVMQIILSREAAFLRDLMASTGVKRQERPRDYNTWEGKLHGLLGGLDHLLEALEDGANCSSWVKIEEAPAGLD